MVYLSMKRSRDSELDTAITNMASCLMLLSRGQASSEPYETNSPSRVFECKTCNRQFPSFQALGGHRASHKKPRLNTDGDLGHVTNLVPTKPKAHECSICGQEFAIGQALGGHMRRHRATTTSENKSSQLAEADSPTTIVKKVNSKRVFSLDLNLTPFENDLEFRLGKVVPTTIELFL
ncbi:hypothetical protein LXL04_021965 [Taraxacum kok-saghyz]